MNFVIFSRSFLPLSGPECFCSTRFASALAAAGHNVQVVTMDWQNGVDSRVYDFLVDKRLKIIRVPPKVPRHAPIWDRFRYMTHEWSAVDIPFCIQILKDVLRSTSNPILISRTHPITSLIVAWHCRKLASKWIAHFSDPIPWYGNESINARVKSLFAAHWVRCALRDASAITLTCDRAKRFYSEEYGDVFDIARTIVVPHIGDPSLTQLYADGDNNDKSATKTIVHTGLLYPDRGAHQMIDAVQNLNKQGVRCRFIQVGEIDVSIKAEVESSPLVEVVNNTDPALSAKAQRAADVVFIPDLMTHLPYSPFCPSKFAYQVFGETPIVVFSRQDSWMGDCARRFPNAGLFFADVDKTGSLADAVKLALDSVGGVFDREGLRNCFSRSSVITSFVDATSRI